MFCCTPRIIPETMCMHQPPMVIHRSAVAAVQEANTPGRGSRPRHSPVVEDLLHHIIWHIPPSPLLSLDSLKFDTQKTGIGRGFRPAKIRNVRFFHATDGNPLPINQLESNITSQDFRAIQLHRCTTELVSCWLDSDPLLVNAHHGSCRRSSRHGGWQRSCRTCPGWKQESSSCMPSISQ